MRLPIGRDMADWQAALDGLDGSEDEAPPVGANWYAALDGLAGSEDEGELVPAPGQNKTQPHPSMLLTDPFSCEIHWAPPGVPQANVTNLTNSDDGHNREPPH